MRRMQSRPRNGWELEVEALGLTWHTHDDGTPYWDESAYYVFSAAQVDELEQATNDLHQLCLQAVEHVVAHDRFADIGISPIAVPLIQRSWREKAPSLYGRFDLAYDGSGPPKLLEYNADTPTSLLEAAVIQWYWLEAQHPHLDQFNSLWEAVVARWSALKAAHFLGGETLAMAYAGPEGGEDHMTVTCMMQETAKEAGIASQALPIKQIGWNTVRGFVGADDRPLRTIFKLFPWEWLWSDPFSAHLTAAYDATRWIEPPWKLILSSKGLLALLWELFPNHPNLLETYSGTPKTMREYVRKPFFSREGANVSIMQSGGTLEESLGTYAADQWVYQAYCPLPDFNGRHPVIGSWIQGGRGRRRVHRQDRQDDHVRRVRRAVQGHRRPAAHLQRRPGSPDRDGRRGAQQGRRGRRQGCRGRS